MQHVLYGTQIVALMNERDLISLLDSCTAFCAQHCPDMVFPDAGNEGTALAYDAAEFLCNIADLYFSGIADENTRNEALRLLAYRQMLETQLLLAGQLENMRGTTLAYLTKGMPQDVSQFDRDRYILASVARCIATMQYGAEASAEDRASYKDISTYLLPLLAQLNINAEHGIREVTKADVEFESLNGSHLGMAYDQEDEDDPMSFE